MIKLIVSDIGGFLINFTENKYIHYLHENFIPSVSEKDLAKFIIPLVEVMEYGTLNVPELERMVNKHFNLKNVDLHWVEGFKEVSGPIMKNIRLINRLAKNYKVVLLTNVSVSRFAEMERNYLKLMKVGGVYASCNLRMRKPSPAIYEFILKKEKVRGSEVVFMDDRIENVIGAEKAGMNAVWFRDYDKLIRDLHELGINTD